MRCHKLTVWSNTVKIKVVKAPEVNREGVRFFVYHAGLAGEASSIIAALHG